MTFDEAVGYLYQRLPVFHNIGARAYRPGLDTTLALCEKLGNPQTKFPAVHIGGTNGKGSTSHMLAAVFGQAGYKTGLYTSPHLKSFTERIRINGVPAYTEFVAGFVEKNRGLIETLNPSFFEVTVAMAFTYFAEQEVDIAIIEVGMGGRLDSTNVITPVLSLITNISYDHMQQLGNTLPAIAREKAGIIKPGVPLVSSERQEPEVMAVFEETARARNAPYRVGADEWDVLASELKNGLQELQVSKSNSVRKSDTFKISLDLCGSYQLRNVRGVLTALEVLREQGWKISDEACLSGLASAARLTGFRGRWTRLGEKPFVVCDTAHNKAGLEAALGQFLSVPAANRHFVLGFVGDKDLSGVFPLLPQDAYYYFCQPSNPRALPATELRLKAFSAGLKGDAYPDVNKALEAALKRAGAQDAVYVGGSTFVVADLDHLP